MMDDVHINGMRLPPQLVSAVAENSWASTDARWSDMFPESELVNPTLYSLDLIRRVNEKWRNESDPAFVGAADGRAVPGELVPSASVLIGELQGDTMIALDYRDGDDNPSVAYLDLHDRWVRVAASFDEFWRRLSGGV
jgi:hypothetical protein